MVGLKEVSWVPTCSRETFFNPIVGLEGFRRIFHRNIVWRFDRKLSGKHIENAPKNLLELLPKKRRLQINQSELGRSVENPDERWKKLGNSWKDEMQIITPQGCRQNVEGKALWRNGFYFVPPGTTENLQKIFQNFTFCVLCSGVLFVHIFLNKFYSLLVSVLRCF